MERLSSPCCCRVSLDRRRKLTRLTYLPGLLEDWLSSSPAVFYAGLYFPHSAASELPATFGKMPFSVVLHTFFKKVDLTLAILINVFKLPGTVFWGGRFGVNQRRRTGCPAEVVHVTLSFFTDGVEPGRATEKKKSKNLQYQKADL